MRFRVSQLAQEQHTTQFPDLSSKVEALSYWKPSRSHDQEKWTASGRG